MSGLADTLSISCTNRFFRQKVGKRGCSTAKAKDLSQMPAEEVVGCVSLFTELASAHLTLPIVRKKILLFSQCSATLFLYGDTTSI